MTETTTSFADRTVADLVAEDYRKAGVFKKHGIDFCCGGGRTVRAVCEKKGLAYEALEAELRQVEQAPPVHDDAAWTLDGLVRHIVETHHGYVRENIPLIREFTAKVARVHGHANPEVVRIAGLFDAVAAELAAHMMKEEQVLFPYIERLAAARRDGKRPERPFFGTVQNPIRMMEAEHETAGDLMKEIRRLSADYTPPAHACNTYRVAYFKLEEFEADLHRHIHLENNILFPRATTLERELTAE
ncbi:iron-sulfur cluster repair di-iron protein [Rhodocaloribacter sp.]